MQTKSWTSIKRALQRQELDPDFDLIVAIGRGGVIPAALVAQKLRLPVQILNIALRDDLHQIRFPQPVLLMQPGFDVTGQKVLIVDDVSRSGQTLQFARQVLHQARDLQTLVFNGQADHSLFDEDCFRFPWAY